MPTHRHTQYLEAFARVQPQVALLLDGSQNDYMEIRRRSPDTRIIMRSYDWSDGGLQVLRRAQHDPVATGRWMADNWIGRVKQWGQIIDANLTYFTGVNEYSVIPGVPIPPFVICEAEFAKRLADNGLRACIGNEGVGHPAEVNAQGKVDWSQYTAWEKVIQETGSILGVHEYWRAHAGPRMNVKPEDEARNRFWYAWRFMQCPFDVPIAVTEWGVDEKVDAPMGTPSHGWQGILSADAYAAQLREYCVKAVTDKRFLGATIFTHDYADREWATYDTDRGLNEICNVAAGLPPVAWYTPGTAPEPPTPTPQPPQGGALVHPLPAGSYSVTQRFYQNPEDYAQFGLPGHNGTDFGAAGGTPVAALADGVVAWADVDPAYGNYVRVYHDAFQANSFYAHLSAIDVRQGDQVEAGQRIGAVGSTGNSTGPHLHLEIRDTNHDGSYSSLSPMPKGRVDPETWCALHGLSLSTGGGGQASPSVFMPLVYG
jgi:hypothetical protein